MKAKFCKCTGPRVSINPHPGLGVRPSSGGCLGLQVLASLPSHTNNAKQGRSRRSSPLSSCFKLTCRMFTLLLYFKENGILRLIIHFWFLQMHEDFHSHFGKSHFSTFLATPQAFPRQCGEGRTEDSRPSVYLETEKWSGGLSPLVSFRHSHHSCLLLKKQVRWPS